MPRWDSFGRSLVFAALAAAGLPVAVTFGGPIFGGSAAARSYLIAAAGIYAIGLCPDRSRRAAALATAVLVGVILALLPLDLRATAVGAAGMIAFVRGVVLANGRRPLRALASEVVFAAAGLAAAAHFARGGLVALCLAIWGYFLVQSGWFLIGDGAVGPGVLERDPFDRARARLLRLLEDDPV
jgi:hypothetical protein